MVAFFMVCFTLGSFDLLVVRVDYLLFLLLVDSIRCWCALFTFFDGLTSMSLYFVFSFLLLTAYRRALLPMRLADPLAYPSLCLLVMWPGFFKVLTAGLFFAVLFCVLVFLVPLMF